MIPPAETSSAIWGRPRNLFQHKLMQQLEEAA